jgi:Trk K+ transport system NAD-binding subunit
MVPLIIVAGGDGLSLRVCEELCGTGHRVVLVWPQAPVLAERCEKIGCGYIPFSPDDGDALRAAGVAEAVSIMALGTEDPLNLRVALRARDFNPKIRVVMRQFNRALARKIEQNLADTTVLSLSAHAAATFAGSASDISCFYALQFPDNDGPLMGFMRRHAFAFGLDLDGVTVAEAQRHLGCRVVAVDEKPVYDQQRHIRPEDELIVFARLGSLLSVDRTFAHVEPRRAPVLRIVQTVRRGVRVLRKIDPIVRRVALVAVSMFAVASCYFSIVLHRDILTAAYFVMATMTTVGYGDITPIESGPFAKFFAMSIMVGGVALSGIFIALTTSAITAARFNATRGLRRIRRRAHIVVCGSGQVGTRVIEYLRSLGLRVVVVEQNPDATLVEMAANRELDLLTGDFSKEAVLDLCNIREAHALVALTDNDTANLEVALGARARAAHLPVILRVQDDIFAGSIARQFGISTTFSTSSLAAPAFAGLSRFPGTRGRITFGDDDYTVGERSPGQGPPPAERCIPLCVQRAGTMVHINDFSEMQREDRLLFLVPLSQFRKSGAAPAAPSTKESHA